MDLHPSGNALDPGINTPPISPQPVPQADAEYQTRGAPPLMPLPQQAKEKKDSDPADEQRYDFFLEDKPKQKQSGLALPAAASGSKLMRIVIVAAGFVLLLILVAVVLTALRSGSNQASANLNSLIFTQQEIIRLSGNADEKLQTTAMKNFAKTTENTTITAQQELKTYLTQNGVKFDEEALAAYADADNDKVLEAAEAADTYDSTFRKTMGTILNDYHGSLVRLAKAAGTTSEQEMLAEYVESARLLQVMASQP